MADLFRAVRCEAEFALALKFILPTLLGNAMHWNASSKTPATPIRASWANPARSSRLDKNFSRKLELTLKITADRAYPEKD